MKIPEKILNVKEVSKIVGLSRTTIWRKQKDGSFPLSRRISSHRTGFISTDIDDWIRSGK